MFSIPPAAYTLSCRRRLFDQRLTDSSGICIEWTLHHITLVPRVPFIRPAAPILAHQPSAGPDWIHEIKWDGWRCQIMKSGGEVRVYTRNGNDWTAQLLDIRDLRRLALDARREAPVKLISGSQDLIQLSETFEDVNELLAAAEEYGLEGIVSKRRDFPYRSGRCPYWLKIKTAHWREANKNRYKRFERNR
jgi:ATP-dependent DNA ligase